MAAPAPASEAAQALVVEGLCVEAADTKVVLARDVSFSLAAGEILGIVGESGSGKTTTGLACLGHAKPGTRITAGKVVIGGRNLLEMDAKTLVGLRRTDVAYVPQAGGFSLNPTLRLRSQLLHSFGEDSDRRLKTQQILEMFERVALPANEAFLKRYPHELSGGQQQRVVIAAALLRRPSVVVLDEPTTGLDVTTQEQIISLVSELCRTEGIAAIFITHDLSVVAEMCDQVAVMYAGRVVELGPIRPMLQQPTHPYTSGLLKSVPDIAGRQPLIGMPGRPPLPGRTEKGCGFAPRCVNAEAKCREVTPPRQTVRDQVVSCFFPILELNSASPPAAEPQRRGDRAAAPVQDSPKSPILQVSVRKAFHGRVDVLHDVNIDFLPGSCTGVVGESGSGKTTLSRIIAGIHSRYEGEIRFHGSPLAPAARHRAETERKNIQYIFQNPYDALNPRRKIWEAVIQPIRETVGGRRAGRARAAQLLESVSLRPQLADRFPTQLSGGELQRVAVARALATEPTLLVCDEVTSALDVSVQASIVKLLKDLQTERDLTIIFVTHNISLIRHIADTVVVIKDGLLVEHATTEDVFQSPGAAYTEALLDAVPDIWRKIDKWEEAGL